MDLDEDQWRKVTEVVTSRGLLPFIDIAYQGFANGIKEDNFGVRQMFAHVPEMIVASSCSKNFALYRDRVGSLSFVSRDNTGTAMVRSQANHIVRTMYSMPPDHGAAVVSHILQNDELRSEWEAEVTAMRERLKSMRMLVGAALRDKAPDHDFSNIEDGNGMFSFVGISNEQVERLKSEFAVYMVGSSRINVAGITADNVDHLTTSIAAVL
jgi:aspartate/tyrosine/aromatic aminotransferase